MGLIWDFLDIAHETTGCVLKNGAKIYFLIAVFLLSMFHFSRHSVPSMKGARYSKIPSLA